MPYAVKFSSLQDKLHTAAVWFA